MDSSNIAIKIIVIDNDSTVHHTLREDLEEYFEDERQVFVNISFSAESAFIGLAYTHISCVIINAGLVDYLEDLIYNLKNTRGVPVVVLSDSTSLQTRLRLMKAGADAILKPRLDRAEYFYAVRNLLNLYYAVPDRSNLVSTFEKLSLRSAQREAVVNDKAIELTSKEYEVLHYFVINAGRYLTPEQIYRNVWNGEMQTLSEDKSVKDIVSRIRKKLNAAGCTAIIETKRGYGYRINCKIAQL